MAAISEWRAQAVAAAQTAKAVVTEESPAIPRLISTGMTRPELASIPDATTATAAKVDQIVSFLFPSLFH